MDFEPGDMQFLRNAVILHARTQYQDWQEPDKKRHLLRLSLTNPRFRRWPLASAARHTDPEGIVTVATPIATRSGYKPKNCWI
jgi:hypothetical protein